MPVNARFLLDGNAMGGYLYPRGSKEKPHYDGLRRQGAQEVADGDATDAALLLEKIVPLVIRADSVADSPCLNRGRHCLVLRRGPPLRCPCPGKSEARESGSP